MAKKEVATVDDKYLAAVKSRPNYLPAITDDSDINQIKQRSPSVPILSLDDDVFTLFEGQTLLKRFDEDELEMYFLFIFNEPQRRAYEGEWDPNDPQDPDCISNNSIEPEESSPNQQSDSCDTCWRSQPDTKRSDKCSWLRNAVVLIRYETDDGVTAEVVARLRLNGNTLFGEENRSANELNAETLIRTYRDTLQAELWYHPVLAFFDKDTKGAQSKLLFEIQVDQYPDEDTVKFIQAKKNELDYDKLTRLSIRDADSGEDSGGNTSNAPAQRETKSSRTSGKGKTESGKTSNSRSKRSSAKDTAGNDSKRSGSPSRSRRAGKSQADTGGETATEPEDGGEGEGEGSGEGAEEYHGNPLENPDVAAAIGNVELP